MSVFVLGNDGKPLMPCSEKRARLLLEKGRAIVKRVFPFVIQLKDRNQFNSNLQDLEVKIDPGSKVTGMCLSRTENKVVNVLNLFELEHRGHLISRKLKARAAMRQARRQRNTRYRQARFLNRKKPIGWLPPSAMHRIETTISWVKRLIRWSPITVIVVERVKFDTQKLQNPEISGIGYQQGTLFQYEVKEYLLEKFNRTCMYCGKKDCIFEVEHVIAKALGGTNRISNLGLACVQCNQKKGSLPIEVFLKNKPELLKKIHKQLKTPLRDAAVMNATRNRLFLELLKIGLPVETGTGGQTKFNRKQFNIPKTHALDAACVGHIFNIVAQNTFHIKIKCFGRGRYSRTILNKYGFPHAYLMKTKSIYGFQTGDIVLINKNLCIGKNIFRIIVSSSGTFIFRTNNKNIKISWRNCRLLQKHDGYEYSRKIYNFLYINGKSVVID